MSERALTGGRQWTKDIPSTEATFDAVSGEFDATKGWRANARVIYYETYWDMSAYTLDDLTFYPISAVLQDGMPYGMAFTDTTDIGLSVIDIVSQEKLDMATVLANYDGSELNLPGQPLSTENFEQIIMEHFRFMTPQVDFTSTNLVLPATTGSFGSLQPSACEKLWIYRILIVNAAVYSAGDRVIVPATRFVMAGTVAKESELEYMMRLKRSYELNQ